MNERHITVVGTRGGHGATTVAAVLALHAARLTPTTLVGHDVADTGALLGISVGEPADAVPVKDGLTVAAFARGATCVVEDCGPLHTAKLDGRDAGSQLAVLRGPCYLGLRTLVGAGRSFDGIVLLVEAGRCLGRRDVEDVVGVPVIAEVAVTERVARTIDAGILTTRFTQLREFLALSRYIHHLDIPTSNTPTPTSSTASSPPPLTPPLTCFSPPST